MLLMGGQACVFYGAAEFSRDLDLLILAGAENLIRLLAALDDLKAELIAVPPFEARHLLRGHAVHFRCRRDDVAGLRIDMMSALRGVADFEELWARRTTIEVEGELVDLLAVEDLVRTKKTQRDKDWPMIRRLIEQNYFASEEQGTPDRVEFWLRELRTPELLVSVATIHSATANKFASQRAAVQAAITGDLDAVARELANEEHQERLLDREYWDPLKRELETLRRIRKLQ